MRSFLPAPCRRGWAPRSDLVNPCRTSSFFPSRRYEVYTPGYVWGMSLKRELGSAARVVFALCARFCLSWFISPQVMDLNPVNVVLESTFTPSEDHHARVAVWRDALLVAVNAAARQHASDAGAAAAGEGLAPQILENAPPILEYVCVGLSTQVGLALIVVSTTKTAGVLTHVQTAHVKTGFGGLLGNKVSARLRGHLYFH